MNFILLFTVILSLWKVKFRNDNLSNCLSVQQTSDVNGIFVMLVFLRHFSQYIEMGSYDFIFQKIDVLLGQLIVTTFLFYSGYGIMYSILHKDNYINTIPKRVLTVLLQFDLAIILFLIVDLLTGQEYSLPTILASFVGWKSVGNSTWYIFAILFLYTITYFSGLISKKITI